MVGGIASILRGSASQAKRIELPISCPDSFNSSGSPTSRIDAREPASVAHRR